MDTAIPEMATAIMTFQYWQVEFLHSFLYDYSNGFLAFCLTLKYERAG
ncbi:transposase [Radiobacillus deserti]|uniref:Transposase n=1 Tax=Radiobacillus deserti TaxID=2594883 RepID=A0A516KJL9_9BACI|nr:transposase [Radiobacillus deserti]QDP41585.1 transposase [Radiobacillus deserti]